MAQATARPAPARVHLSLRPELPEGRSAPTGSSQMPAIAPDSPVTLVCGARDSGLQGRAKAPRGQGHDSELSVLAAWTDICADHFHT